MRRAAVIAVAMAALFAAVAPDMAVRDVSGSEA